MAGEIEMGKKLFGYLSEREGTKLIYSSPRVMKADTGEATVECDVAFHCHTANGSWLYLLKTKHNLLLVGTRMLKGCLAVTV